MTVLEAFAKAFGPLPEGVEGCYICAEDRSVECICPTLSIKGCAGAQGFFLDAWDDMQDAAFGPNIADRPAESFRGFFGDRYDAVLDEVKA